MRKWGEPNACAFSSALPPCRQLSFPPLPRCRTCSARHLAASLSHPAPGRAGMRRVGGRRRSSVSDRANASVMPAGEVTDDQAAIPDKCRGAGSGFVRSPPSAAASELLPCLLLCHADAPAPLGSRQRAPCCCPPRRWGGAVLLNFVTALAPAAAYAQPGLLAPHEPDQGTRAGHTDALAPLGSRKCASCCCPHWLGGGRAVQPV